MVSHLGLLPLAVDRADCDGGRLWRQIQEDWRYYLALRHPGCGLMRGLLIGLRSPGLLILAVHRLTHRHEELRRGTGWLLRVLVLKLLSLLGRTLVVSLTKSDIAPASAIDGGVCLSDGGCLIIGSRRIGRGTIIHQRVTIGGKAGGGGGKPIIGEDVWIGSDCVIYGDISIGSGATILPGTVISMNVPARAAVAGNPGRVVAREFDNRVLRHSLGAVKGGRRPQGSCGHPVM